MCKVIIEVLQKQRLHLSPAVFNFVMQACEDGLWSYRVRFGLVKNSNKFKYVI
jgi:hypothetical protein